MAGLSRRFRDVGIVEPKWALQVRGRSMLEWALDSLQSLLPRDSEIRVVALRAHQKYLNVGLGEYQGRVQVIVVDDVPHGQAMSVLSALSGEDADRCLLVWNCDSHLTDVPPCENLLTASTIVCSRLPGDHWSFAEVAADGRVVRTAEKNRISDFASVGLYTFQTTSLFSCAVQAHIGAGTETGEIYVAPLYNWLLRWGEAVQLCEIPSSNFVALGTPQEWAKAGERLRPRRTGRQP
jgi:dTDP-glucose pyrophosphorylase